MLKDDIDKLIKKYRLMINICSPILIGAFTLLFFIAYMIYIVNAY